MIYFDSTYVVRCYLDEPGAAEVRALGAREQVACAQIGQAEVSAAFHRKLREGSLTPEEFAAVTRQFEADIIARVFTWLPLREIHFADVRQTFSALPATVFLRGADALHLAVAREAGFREIYTNDRQMLNAAPQFWLTGINVILAVG